MNWIYKINFRQVGFYEHFASFHFIIWYFHSKGKLPVKLITHGNPGFLMFTAGTGTLPENFYLSKGHHSCLIVTASLNVKQPCLKRAPTITILFVLSLWASEKLMRLNRNDLGWQFWGFSWQCWLQTSVKQTSICQPFELQRTWALSLCGINR